MDSRERTFRSLNFEEPDRVPIDLWMSSGCREHMQRSTGMSWSELLNHYDVDLRYIPGPTYIGPALRSTKDVAEDIWGVPRRLVRVPTKFAAEVYREVERSPLAGMTSPEQVEAYDHWPSPDWFDYSDIASQCEAIRSAGRVVVFMGDRLNRIAQLKPAMYLRGMEQVLIDLHLNPEIAHAVFGRIRRFYLGYAERIFTAAGGRIDILLTGDDFGAQEGLLVSAAQWERFLGDGFADYVGLAKSHGARVMHHTCGAVRSLIPLLMERGLDVLQSLQPEAADMDPLALKSEYGRRLAFHGGISIQRVLPFGSPDDVREEVKRVFGALAPGGGYIACTAHNIQADTPCENVTALLQAYAECGRYR